MESETACTVNRELIARDLDRIASHLSPRIVSQLAQIVDQAAEAMKTIDLPLIPKWTRPILSKAIRDQASRRLPASVAPQLSDALQRLLVLSDEDLTTLCSVVATELGAWCGYADPLPEEVLSGAFAPVMGLDG